MFFVAMCLKGMKEQKKGTSTSGNLIDQSTGVVCLYLRYYGKRHTVLIGIWRCRGDCVQQTCKVDVYAYVDMRSGFTPERVGARQCANANIARSVTPDPASTLA